MYPRNESDHVDIVILDAQALFGEEIPRNVTSRDAKKKSEEEAPEPMTKEVDDSMKEGEKGEREKTGEESKEAETDGYSFKKLLFLEEKNEEDNKNEPEKRVNKMSEMMEIMMEFFGALRKDKVKEDEVEILKEDELDNEMQQREFKETEVPEKRELNPSILTELKCVIEGLMDTIKFDRIREVDYTSEDNENIILAEVTLAEVPEDDLTDLQTLTNVSKDVEPCEATLPIDPEDPEEKEDVNGSAGVKELKELAREYLEAMGVKKLKGKKMKKAFTENKSLVIKIVQNALETIVEEENLDDQPTQEGEKSTQNEEPQKTDSKAEEEGNALPDLYDEENELLPRPQTPFRRYFRTIKKSHKK